MSMESAGMGSIDPTPEPVASEEAQQEQSGSDQENKERAVDLLKGAFSLAKMAFKRYDTESGRMKVFDPSRELGGIQNGSYESVNGIILVKNGDELRALPYSADAISILSKAYFRQVPMGVPNLNDKDTWINPEGEDFKKWKAVVDGGFVA